MKKKLPRSGVKIEVFLILFAALELYVFWEYSIIAPQAEDSFSSPRTVLPPVVSLKRSSAPTVESRTHCIGENFQNASSSARFRSCRYQDLCWNGQDIVFFGTKDPRNNASTYFSSSLPAPVQLLPRDNIPFVPVFSTDHDIVTSAKRTLHKNTIWIPLLTTQPLCEQTDDTPFLLLDFYLPIFALLEMFGFTEHKVHISFLSSPCQIDIPIVAADGFTVEFASSSHYLAPMCAKTVLAGMGWLGSRHYETILLEDRGPKQLKRPHNIRRAATFIRFRKYVLKLLGLSDDKKKEDPILVTVLLGGGKAKTLEHQEQLEQKLSALRCRQQILHTLPSSFADQIRIAQDSSIFVVYSQSIPETAIFLPHGSVLIAIGTTVDWDIWNNMGHIHVHWLKSDRSLSALIKQEIERLAFVLPSWNGIDTGTPIYGSLLDSARRVDGAPPPGRAHCIGEHLDSPHPARKSWFRSCRYENMCLDLRTNEFNLFGNHLVSPQLDRTLHLSSLPMTVAMAQPSALFSRVVKWKPVLGNKAPTEYHQLQDAVVWILYNDWDLCNMGHVVWDMFLPIYTILELFGLEAHVVLLTPRTRQRTCIPYLMAPREHVLGENDLGRIKPEKIQKTVICTRNFLTGMAWLQDHGVNSHGFLSTDFEHPENVGRGPQLARFRDYTLKTVNLTRVDLSKAASKSLGIIFSYNSSRRLHRRHDFTGEMTAVARKFGSRVNVQGLNMWNYSFPEQMEFSTQAAVFVSVVGSGTIPAYFLPTGASLILLYPSGEMLDWDIWNQYGDIYTHWIRLDDLSVDLILTLIGDELDRIEAGFL